MDIRMKQKMSRLGNLENLDLPEDIRSTPFWSRRDNFKDNRAAKVSLSHRPLYRMYKVLDRIAKREDVVDEYIKFREWSFKTFDELDEEQEETKTFRRKYGKYPVPRSVLSVRSCFNLYIKTH